MAHGKPCIIESDDYREQICINPASGPAMSRLHPDPLVAVGDIQQAIIDFLQEKGCNDLGLLLKAPSGKMTWKSAPQEDWLGGSIAALVKRLLKISPICVFSSKN